MLDQAELPLQLERLLLALLLLPLMTLRGLKLNFELLLEQLDSLRLLLGRVPELLLARRCVFRRLTHLPRELVDLLVFGVHLPLELEDALVVPLLGDFLRLLLRLDLLAGALDLDEGLL